MLQYNTEESRGHYTMGKNPVNRMANTAQFYKPKVPKGIKFTDAENRLVTTRDWDIREMGCHCSMWMEF